MVYSKPLLSPTAGRASWEGGDFHSENEDNKNDVKLLKIITREGKTFLKGKIIVQVNLCVPKRKLGQSETL